METQIEITEEVQLCSADEDQLYTIEEVFDRIDTKFVDFYGEYGRKMVNERRTEWNKDDLGNFKMF